MTEGNRLQRFLIGVVGVPSTGMNTNEDLVAAAHAELTKSIEGLIASNEWEKHLKMQARFHNYSFGNVMWLLSQSLSRGVFPGRLSNHSGGMPDAETPGKEAPFSVSKARRR